MSHRSPFALALALVVGVSAGARAEEPMLGYTTFRSNLPGGRHANVRTMRAAIGRIDGTGIRTIGDALVDGPESWTQFAGWSPDGKKAIVYRGWQDPENAKWEEEHKSFRMDPGRRVLDSCLVDLESGRIENLTAVERVSNYNGGLFFLPGGRKLGFTPLIGGISKPYVMDLDGRNKKDVSGEGKGFAYGYSFSPDGRKISYHEDYQIYIAEADGTGKKKVETGNPFNFGPLWSPDGESILFLSGVHGHSNPYLARRDGSGARKLVDLNGYQGWIAFLDVPDFHDGSSDTPVWAVDGKLVYHTAKVGDVVELFSTTPEGKSTRLTNSPPGTLHYHPTPSPDGRYLAFGSKREGTRRIHVLDLTSRVERRVTDLKAGEAAMWPHWRP